MNPSINFFTEDYSFRLKEKKRHQLWLTGIIVESGFSLKNLNYIICSDEYLLQLNHTYLRHNYYTDILTFDNSDRQLEIDGDIYISMDRVKDNAKAFEISTSLELKRVMVHGLLHLLGHSDGTKEEKALMAERENDCLRSFANVPRGTF